MISSTTACFESYGSVELGIEGGMGEYNIFWGDLNPESLTAGDHVVLIQDQNLCELSYSFEILSNPQIQATTYVIDANNGDNGSAEIVVFGGTAPYLYGWSSGSNESVASGLGQGSYQCLVTDAENCSESFEIEVIDVSIEEEDFPIVSVFPVPFNNEIFVEVRKPGKCVIYSITGQKVWEEWVSTRARIDTSGWSEGFYMLNNTERLIKINQ